jgi:hypothetical protein
MVLHGLNQGTGKSLIGETMGRLYGENYAFVTHDNMEGSFSGWANGKQFVSIDDVTATDKRRDLDRMKSRITQTSIWINIKNVPEYSIPDCINYILSSNHNDVLFLEQQDRRFFIWEVLVAALEQAFYDEYNEWMLGPDMVPALLYHMMYDVDLTGFNPNAAPPVTEAKKRMQALALTDIDNWIVDALASPDDMLRVGDVVLMSDLLSLDEIKACYASFAGKEPDITNQGFARKLSGRGLRQAAQGRQIYVYKRPLTRYYIVRNRDKWSKATDDQIKRYLGEIAAKERMER